MRRFVPLAIVLALAGCTAPVAELEFSHVHGAAYLPDEGALFLATHYGVIVGQPIGTSWSWSYAGDERFDYMGFAQDGNQTDVFYSSGHPNDPRAYGGVHLGLRRSVDGANTWEQRSLKGEVDFHALTGIPGQGGHVVGSWNGRMRLSSDAGLSWQEPLGPPADVLALAASKVGIYAGTTDGLFMAQNLDDTSSWSRITGQGEPTQIVTLAVSRNAELMLASSGDYRAGTAVRSLDEGASWTPLSEPLLSDAPRPVVFAVDPENHRHAFASTSDGAVFESVDAGATWHPIRTI